MTILYKLHSKLSGKSNSYAPPSVSGNGSGMENGGNGEFYVKKVLDKLCQSSTDCARAVEDLYQANKPKEAGTSKKGKSMDTETRYVRKVCSCIFLCLSFN
ncbi:hypothetical protein DPMN_036884 [Dreissena polymorpha]|uniref:Uncharacterized protein n=1 Tax=Dreissena polymorpha TaxID=45954 RepID=A0A9D4RP92_DREPO|nr:hypothetical protein DPMN_036884 [Dreissena polymorpha]